MLATDLCIVGGGLAGLTLAAKFLGTSVRVVLLESGQIGESDADSLADGFSTAHPYFPHREAGPRRLGGAADTWGAWCRPFDSIDFEERPWPGSGWPLAADELRPFNEEARQFLRIPSQDFDGASWANSLPPLYRHIQDNTSLTVGVWQESPLAPMSQDFVQPLQDAENMTVLLDATALEIGCSAGAESVEGITCGDSTGKRFVVQASHYVLAAGTLGTTRLLLASNTQVPAGVGNRHGMVGRFFAEHPHIVAGSIQLTAPSESGRPRFASLDRGLVGTPARIEMERPRAGIRAGIMLRDELRRAENLLSVIAHLRPPSVEPPRAALEFFRDVRHKDLKSAARGIPGLFRHAGAVADVVYRRLLQRPRQLELYVQVETAPTPDSRLVLSDEKDVHGMPRAELQWLMGNIDKESLARTVELMGGELERIGLGRLELAAWLRNGDDAWTTEPFGGYHLMGTTRMSTSPEEGVVDPDCRVHGVDNLWIVGPSVFPTYGSANPGMTAVALTLRSAEKLRQALVTHRPT